MIKTIIFDAGGVLFETDWDKANKDFKEKTGKVLFIRSAGSKEAIEEFDKTIIGQGSMDKVLELLGIKKKDIKKAKKQYIEDYIRYKIINKELLSFIEKLKESYRVICLTDLSPYHFEANQKIGLFNIFEKVFASNIVGMRKPDLNLFKKVLDELGVKPEEVIFIDDNQANIGAANYLGINAIYYTEFPDITNLKKQINSLLR